MTKQIQTVGAETKIAEIITRYLVKRGREGQMWQNQAFNSGLIKELSQFVAQAQQEAVSAERLRIQEWLLKNQTLETPEFGKIVLWGWIWAVVNNNEDEDGVQ